MDINRVWLSGLAISQPVLTSASGKTPLASFNLQVNEQFTDSQGVTKSRSNIIRIEGLGKTAASIMEKVHHGVRYSIEGYIRQDTFIRPGPKEEPTEHFKVRVFAVSKDGSGDGAQYDEGLRQALGLLEKSRDKEAAVESLRRLLAVR